MGNMDMDTISRETKDLIELLLRDYVTDQRESLLRSVEYCSDLDNFNGNVKQAAKAYQVAAQAMNEWLDLFDDD